MAIKREQYQLGIISVLDFVIEGKDRIFDVATYEDTTRPSVKTFTSENRAFRMFCKNTETRTRTVIDAKGKETTEEYIVKLADEFTVLNLSIRGLRKKDKRIAKRSVKHVLKYGFYIRQADGTKVHQKRVLTSASQTRVSKRVFTSLDVETVRSGVSFGAKFPEMVKVANMEARYGLSLSSTIEITNESYSFDIMPDYEIERTHAVKQYDWKNNRLYESASHTDVYTPNDGQGTMLPSAAVRTSHRLQLISRAERDLLLKWLPFYNEDVREAKKRNHVEFLKAWAKVPSAFQIRYGFTKGLLLVHPHNLYTKDCKQRPYRAEWEFNKETGKKKAVKCMEFWKEAGQTVVEKDEETGEDQHRRYYDFSRDIMFTDSMWKENFDPKFMSEDMPMKDRAKLEIVLWQKPRVNNTIFMGYQYWQSLKETVSPKEFADRAQKELKDTIFSNADDAKAFLGLYDTGRNANEFGESLERAGGRIQKVIELLTENPNTITERYVQETLLKTRKKYIADMATGRIPVSGSNPYVVTCPELQFGEEPLLQKGEYYFNGTTKRYAAFRSPLTHKSESVVLNTKDVAEYNVFNTDILIMNPFDDICPRMGGMDTDGDKVALTDNEEIVDAVHVGLPMLFDPGFAAKEVENSVASIYKFDLDTILDETALSIGEITNMATAWKDIAKCKRIMRSVSRTASELDDIVCILRFMQGWSIDFAKTGFFPEFPSYIMNLLQPHWKQYNVLAKIDVEDEDVYTSTSQLGQLYNAVKAYLPIIEAESKQKTNDFSFEFSAGADDNEVNRIEPIVAELESNYRNELENLSKQSFTDEEDREQALTAIMDKYSYAVQSIDGDIRDIAAAAYQHTYFGSTSKGKSISFPWVTCYEGMLLNIAASTDEDDSLKKTKLRKVEFSGHIDDIPAELKFYRNVSKGEDYTVEVKIPNGTYPTFKRNGQVFVKMEIKSIVEKREVSRPVDKHVTFQITGFNTYGTDPHEIIELLQVNKGVIRLLKRRQAGENRACVYIGKKQVASVSARNKNTVAPYLKETGACELIVQNYDKLEPTFFSVKEQRDRDVKVLFLDMVFVRTLALKKKTKQEEVKETVEQQEEVTTTTVADDSYYAGAYGGDYAGYVSAEATPSTVEVEDTDELGVEEETSVPTEFHNNSLLAFESSIMEKINRSADYWNVDFDVKDMDVAGISMEITGKLQFGVPCAVVTVVMANGQKGRVEVGMTAKNTFEVFRDGKKPIPSAFRALILQFAHYELYADYMFKKQA